MRHHTSFCFRMRNNKLSSDESRFVFKIKDWFQRRVLIWMQIFNRSFFNTFKLKIMNTFQVIKVWKMCALKMRTKPKNEQLFFLSILHSMSGHVLLDHTSFVHYVYMYISHYKQIKFLYYEFFKNYKLKYIFQYQIWKWFLIF